MSNNATPKTATMPDVLAELRRQGWRLEPRTDGGHKALPPDPTKSMVVLDPKYANREGGMIEVVRTLRRNGFVWPPARTNGHETIEAIIDSTPFPAKPNPGAREASPAESRAAHREAEARSVPDAELAFLALKESREFLQLAAEELKLAQRDLLAAEERVRGSREAYNDALVDLRAKKRAFDAMYDAPEEVLP